MNGEETGDPVLKLWRIIQSLNIARWEESCETVHYCSRV
jgi:hypothetical protein